MKTKFLLGAVYFTEGIKKEIQANPDFSGFIIQSLQKHQSGDWGILGESDRKYNDLCLANHSDRIFSSYPIQSSSSKTKDIIWIITDLLQNNTIILFPYEN